MAAKLSSVAGANEVVVSERVFTDYEKSSKLRQRTLLRDCGCRGRTRGGGLDQSAGTTQPLWNREHAPGGLGLDSDQIHRLRKPWCPVHGSEFCEAVVTGKRSNR